MGVISPTIVQQGLLNQSSAAIIDGSLRFDRVSDSVNAGYLTRTFTAGNSKKWTWSAWIKRDKLGITNRIFGGNDGTANDDKYFTVLFGNPDYLRFGGYNTFFRTSNALYRDAGWYHIVVNVDIDNASSADKYRAYINSEPVTWSSTSDETDTGLNRAGFQGYLGTEVYGTTPNNGFGGSMTQCYFVDGLALGPEYFGFTDPLTNTWRPKKFEATGTTVNNGTVWSDTLVSSDNSYAGGQGPTQAFNGVAAGGVNMCQKNGVGGNLTWTFSGLKGSCRVWIGNDGAAITDGNGIIRGSNVGSGETWVSLSGDISDYNGSIIITPSSDSPSLGAVEVDGVIMKDSTTQNLDYGVNGFHLPMDGNLPIGQDQSGKGNDWTPSGFGGSTLIPKATGALPILNTLNGGTDATVGVRTDAYHSNLVVAMPLVTPTMDVSNQVNSGTTAKTVTQTGSAADIATSTLKSQFYGSSSLFAGNVARLEVSGGGGADGDYDFGTGDFCIECWFYPTALVNTNNRLFCSRGDRNLYQLMVGSTGYLEADINATVYQSAAGLILTNKWSHCAVTRESGTLRIFVNGINVKEQASVTADLDETTGIDLGYESGYSSYINGYMNDARVYKGVAKYTENFIPASTDPDILPDTPSGVALGSQLTKVPVTDGSVYFDGTSDSLTFTSTSDVSLDGDFTIEFWAYPNTIVNDTSDPSPITMPTDGSAISQIYIHTTNFNYTLHKSSAIVSTGNNTAVTNRWQHVAFTRSGTTVYAFFDGVLQNTATSSATFGGTSGTFRLGSFSEDNGNYDGYMSNVRIVKGTALYTSNFTPPAAPLTNVTNTELLCCQSNILAGAATVSPSVTGSINDGVVWSEQSTITPPASGFNSGGEIQFAFDGLITTLTSGAGSKDTFFIINFAKPITVSTSLEVYMSSGSSEFSVNGGSYAVQDSGAWRDLSFTGTLTHLSVRGDTAQTYGNNAPRLSAIRIDGSTILTDPMTRVGDTAASTSNPFTNNINAVMGQETDYATLNPLYRTGSYSDGNLVQTTTAGNGHYRANIAINESSGKWYFEYQPTGSDVPGMVGLVEQDHPRTSNLNGATAYSYYGTTGHKQGSPSSVDTAYGATFTFGDVIGVAFDTDNGGSLEYFKNGVSQGIAFSNEFPTKTAAKNNFPNFPYFPAFSAGSSVNVTTYNVNFGQKPFKYVPPEGFQPLNYANLQSPAVVRPDQYVGVTTYLGTAAVQTISGLNFQSDLIWIKSTSAVYNHRLFDSVRGFGAGKALYPDLTEQQGNNSGNDGALSVNTDGWKFTTTGARVNDAQDYVGWCWKAGGNKNTFNVDGVGYANASDVSMDAGALNSSEYLQDEIYSDTNYMYGYSPAHGAQFSANQPATNAFNGVIGDAWDDSAGPSGAGAGVLVRFTPPSQVASNKVEVFVNYYNDISFYTGSPTGAHTKVAGPFTNTISRYFTLVDCGIVPAWDYMQIEVPSGVGNMGLYFGGIKIGGKLLVDSNVTPPNIPSIAATGASVGTKQGFSITKHTSSSTSGGPMTVAHGLSQKPDFIIGKDMDNASTYWAVYHSSLTATKRLHLDDASAATANANYWSNIDPTSSVVYTNSASWMYTSASFIMYSWHNVPGLQKFGLYSGIDSTDGIFLELGFRPAIIMFKNITDGSTEWTILDDKRNGYNNGNQILFPSTDDSENATQYGDFVSNGFKFRINSGYVNASGDEYIYAAWAHQPMNNLYGGQSNAR